MKRNFIRKYISLSLSLLILLSAILSGCANSKTNTHTVSSTQTNNASLEEASSYNSLFKKDNIVNLNLNISKDELDKMFSSDNTGVFHSADITIEDETISKVGICIKGNMSYRTVSRSDSNRYSFAVDFTQYESGKSYYGLNNLVLNNNSGDASFLREYIAYEMLNSIGAPAPLCTFAKLSINGEYFGLYTMVESPYNSQSFAKRVFGADENIDTYEAGIGSSFASESSLKNISLTSGNSENSSNLNKLYEAISNLNEENYKDIENILDVDSFLKYAAANVAFGSYDSYLSTQAQNYYLVYYNNKFYFVPWDYDKSFVGFEGDQCISCAIKIDNPIFDTTTAQLPLLKLIGYNEYKERYHSYLRELTNYLDNIENRITDLSNLIRDDVVNDPTKLFTNEQFKNELVYSDSQIDTSNISFPIISKRNKGNQPTGNPNNSSNSPKGDIPSPPSGQRPAGGDNQSIKTGPQKSSFSLMTYAIKLRENLKSQLS